MRCSIGEDGATAEILDRWSVAAHTCFMLAYQGAGENAAMLARNLEIICALVRDGHVKITGLDVADLQPGYIIAISELIAESFNKASALPKVLPLP